MVKSEVVSRENGQEYCWWCRVEYGVLRKYGRVLGSLNNMIMVGETRESHWRHLSCLSLVLEGEPGQ